MALFLLGYLTAISSTVAFIVAILTPRWIYPNTQSVNETSISSPSDAYYRGIFYVDFGYGNGTCRDWILLPKETVAQCRQPYAIACASLSIAAAGLSVILLWLAAGYLFVRRKRLFPKMVFVISLLTFVIFWISVVIWIVMLVMNLDENKKLRRENVGFSLWIAVGASGGYLLAFLSFLIYAFSLRRRKIMTRYEKNTGRF